ncbi:uncharacterized protein FTJAE_683 [Fusarium tjaetaba]|uniref:Fungal N-terminal domain-containing protein n=1 Tax=Fusarium tjaetaba TaxID=1567544 RepID=A0A8H5W9G5_9HYPO|nr:uncharacterized protein FTJAE_683 [Fusarium tjaetaba]KAF5650118.1 hypothetical protein FTJAE_683 [Fusarium tjaetaba]
MDPLSITSASVALAATVYRCAIEVKSIVGTIADAADSLSDLAEEAQLIQEALQGVEVALQDNQEAISQCKIEEVFSIAVKGCRATLACIKQEFELLLNRHDWRARFMLLWKSSVREVQALVGKKQSALTVAKEDIRSLIPTYWTCRDTILGCLDKETANDIYVEWGNRDSKMSVTEFDFDYELINTRAYRRALAQAQTRSKRELPYRDLDDSPGRKPNAGIIEPVNDLIDLSYEPTQQGASMSPHMPYKSYIDLTGLRFLPRTADRGVDSSETLDSCKTAEPADIGESDMSPDSGDQDLENRTALLEEYVEGRKDESLPIGGRPTARVRLAYKREVVDIKDHPEVTEINRVDRAFGIGSDEPLDSSLVGSLQAPNIRESNLQKSLAALEAKHGHAQRRWASPRGSVEMLDEIWKDTVTTKVPAKKKANHSKYQSFESRSTPEDDMRHRRTSIVRQKRPKVKQNERSKSTDSTQVSPGTPPKANNSRFLKTVGDLNKGADPLKQKPLVYS